MNTDGSHQVKITDNKGNDSRPIWSPDEKQIVFSSDKDSTDKYITNEEIYRILTDSSNQVRLTDNPAYDTCTDWKH
jgi:Tol biopolymer transport system component